MAEKIQCIYDGILFFYLSPELELEFLLIYRSWVHVILFQNIVHRIHMSQKMHLAGRIYTHCQHFELIQV